MLKSRTYIAIPPGMTIKEMLVERGMNQNEFAARMDLSEKHVSRLINGDVQLTQDVALRLEYVLGVPASFWNRLESKYRETLTKAKAENDMENDEASKNSRMAIREMSVKYFEYKSNGGTLGWNEFKHFLKEQKKNVKSEDRQP